MKRLLIIIALAGAVMVPAVANADTADASGKLGSVGKSQAKRFVTKVAKQYQLQEADRSDYGPFTQDPTVRCKRVSRTAVDCNVEVLIFDDFEECTYADSGYNSPPDFGDHTDENGCFEDEDNRPRDIRRELARRVAILEAARASLRGPVGVLPQGPQRVRGSHSIRISAATRSLTRRMRGTY